MLINAPASEVPCLFVFLFFNKHVRFITILKFVVIHKILSHMRTNFPVVFLVLLLLVFVACGPSQREKAVGVVANAEAMAASGDTLNAIDLLKTVPVQYPKAKVQIEVSKKIADELYRQLIDNRKAQLVALDKSISQLEEGFIKEKTEFDTYVQYIPKRLKFSQSWNKSFIQVNLDERGEIFLTSHYMGKGWLRHTAIKVYDEGLESQTEKVALDDPNNRKSDFLEYKWEKVSYTQGRSDLLIQFIAKNYQRNLKCAYMGSNYYYIVLEGFNKEAIHDAYVLSQNIKQRKQLQLDISTLEKKRSNI